LNRTFGFVATGTPKLGDSLTPLIVRLGRSKHSIRWRTGYLNLQGTHISPNGWRTKPAWTEQDIAYLVDHYGITPTKEMAARLNRRKSGVYQKAWSLGLRHPLLREFTDDENRAIRLAHDHGISITDLADALARDLAVVSKHAIRIGLCFAKRSARASKTRRAGRPKVTLVSILALAGDPAHRSETVSGPTTAPMPAWQQR